MPRKLVGAFAAVLSMLLLPGCAAVMMTGASGLPIAMMAGSAMEGLGLLDDDEDELDYYYDDEEEPLDERNPALLRLPAFSDTRLIDDRARLNASHRRFLADIEGHLSTEGAADCVLDEDTRWLLARRQTPADYEQAASLRAAHQRPRAEAVEAVLVEGDCQDGRPEGPFVAVTRFAEVQLGGAGTITVEDRRRVSGTMRSGGLEGEVVRAGVRDSVSSATGNSYRTISHAITRYRAGELSDRHIAISYHFDQFGEPADVTTLVEEQLSASRQRITSYVGSMLHRDYQQVEGLRHGWFVTHPVEVSRNDRRPGSRVCYQHGVIAANGACASS